MILKRLVLLVIIIFIATACNKLKGPEKPKDLISKDKMVDILIDAKFITTSSSKNKIIMRDSSLNMDTYIYEKHKIDSLQFVLSNNYYAFHIEEYEDIYTKLADSLEKLKVELKETEAREWKEKTKREADSIEQVLKDKNITKDSMGIKDLKSLIIEDSLEVLMKKEAILKGDDKFLEESIEEIEGLIEPISEN